MVLSNRAIETPKVECVTNAVWLDKRDKVLAALEPSEYGPKGIGIFANVLVEGIYLKINLELNNSAIYWF